MPWQSTNGEEEKDNILKLDHIQSKDKDRSKLGTHAGGGSTARGEGVASWLFTAEKSF